MNNDFEINIATDFSKRLGARYIYEGKFSGEDFLARFLRPLFIKAKDIKAKLRISLDGVLGYPSSFVSGSFGKLSIEFGADEVLNTIVLISEKKIRIEKIEKEIKNPRKK